jgi:hypothetical protein
MDHGTMWILVYGGLAAMGRRDHFRAQEIVVIAWGEREREEFVGVLTNGASWR